MAVDKLVDSTQLDADLTSVANAIRTKGGTSASLAFPAGFVSAVEAIPSGGGGGSVSDLIAGTWPSGAVTDNVNTVARAYALYGNSAMTSFQSSTITDLRENSFKNCTALVSVNLPALTVMRNSTGTNTNAPGTFFESCSKLESVKMPELVNMYGNYAFSASGKGTTNGLTIVLPKIQNLGVRAFRGTKCAAVDLGPDLVGILTDTFYNGSYGAVILRKASVVSAVNTDAIRSLTNVYVPQSLISSYQTASNWSSKYSGGYITFHAIEGSQYENYYADGTPIT